MSTDVTKYLANRTEVYYVRKELDRGSCIWMTIYVDGNRTYEGVLMSGSTHEVDDFLAGVGQR